MVGSLTPPPGYMKGLTCRTVRGLLRNSSAKAKPSKPTSTHSAHASVRYMKGAVKVACAMRHDGLP